MVNTIEKTKTLSNVDFGYIEDRRAQVNGLISDNITKFNRYRQPTGNLNMGGLRGYVFFTRPDLNLFKNGNPQTPNDSVSLYLGAIHPLKGLSSSSDLTNYSALQSDSPFLSPFIPVLTNHAKGYSPEDQTIDVIEKGETNWGSKIKYGRHGIPSRSSGSVSITFADTKDLHVYKLIALWTDYIENAYLGFVSPKRSYIHNKVLDYAASMFYIVVRQDGREIVHWEKLVGIFPKNRPDSAFATTSDNFAYPEFNIQFDYSLKSKGGMLDPKVLYEFNAVSSLDKRKSNIVANSYSHANDQANLGYTLSPYIKQGDPSKFKGERADRYYLDWIQYN